MMDAVVVAVANWIMMSYLAIEIVMGQMQSEGATLPKGLCGWPTLSVG